MKNLAEQIKEIHRENTFNESDLNNFKQKLEKLEKELTRPTNVSIERQSTSFIDNLSVRLPSSGKIQMRLFRKNRFSCLKNDRTIALFFSCS